MKFAASFGSYCILRGSFNPLTCVPADKATAGLEAMARDIAGIVETHTTIHQQPSKS